MVKQDHATLARSSPGCESRSLHQIKDGPVVQREDAGPSSWRSGFESPWGCQKRRIVCCETQGWQTRRLRGVSGSTPDFYSERWRFESSRGCQKLKRLELERQSSRLLTGKVWVQVPRDAPDAGSSSGRTPDSDSGKWGSNPCLAANKRMARRLEVRLRTLTPKIEVQILAGQRDERKLGAMCRLLWRALYAGRPGSTPGRPTVGA